MSKSLEVKPLLIPPVLARWIGRCAAVVLQQLHYWIQKSQHFHNGLKWVYNTYAQWASQIQFFGEATIKRAFQLLAQLGLIRVEQRQKHEFDRTNWYAIDYPRLNYLLRSMGSERSDRRDRFDPIEEVKMILSSYIDPETTSEITTETPAAAAEAVSEPSEPQPTAPGQNSPACQSSSLKVEAIGEDPFSAAAPPADFLKELSELAIELNPTVRGAIKSHPDLVPAALARVKESLSWATNRTGLFLKALTTPTPHSPLPTPHSPPPPRIDFHQIESSCMAAWQSGDRSFVVARLRQLQQDGFAPEVAKLCDRIPSFAALLSNADRRSGSPAQGRGGVAGCDERGISRTAAIGGRESAAYSH